MSLLAGLDLGPLDLAALVYFLMFWFGYEPVMVLLGRRLRALNFTMLIVRRHWMATMLLRDNRIADASLLGNVMHSTSFFASTTVLVIAALVSALAHRNEIQLSIETLDLAARSSTMLFEIKLVLPLIIIIGGFFRFTWSLRQFNYALAFIGATPPVSNLKESHEDLANDVSEILSSAAGAFDAGVRAYYFGFSTLFWFGGPLPFIAATSIIIGMLLRRQIVSATAKAVHRGTRKLAR